MKKPKPEWLQDLLNFSWIKKEVGTDHPHGKKVAHYLLFIILAIVTTLLVSYRGGRLPAAIIEGQIAPYDIKADRNYEIIDEDATATFKADALKNVKVVYTFDPFLGSGMVERIKAAVDEMRRLLKSYSSDLSESVEMKDVSKKLDQEQLAALKKIWDEMSGTDISEKELKVVIDSLYDNKFLAKLTDTVKGIMTHPIVSEKKLLQSERDKGVMVRVLPATGEVENLSEEEWGAKKIDSALSSEEMQKEVTRGKYIPDSLSIDQYQDRAIIQIAASMIQPNMVFDAQETELKRQSALKSVKDIVIAIQSGEAIVRGGARYETWHVKVLTGIKKEKSVRSLPLEMMGSFLMIVTIYLVVYMFGRRYIRLFAPKEVDPIFLGSLMVVMLLFLRISLFVAASLYESMGMDIPRTALSYAIPMAAAVMLVRFVINAETAVLFAIVMSALAGIVVSSDMYFTAFTLISSLIAAVAVSHTDKRSAILHAGIITGVVNAIVVLSIHLINAASVIEPLSLKNVLWYELLAFANGVGCSIFVLIIAPLTESIFGYTTDIKLLELANLNHPLLRELIIRAPGTYHHSHLVGILAEEGAEAVGANPLLARVGAYYHDIGKIKKPAYFSENMPEGSSIHDNLSPHMSSLIVSSHVKEGLEFAKMYKLPKVITSMIPQHHGTKRISFFYEKARQSTDPSLQKVEEKDFRYPGPKPKSREAAILMLSDGAEAAVRALKEKTPQRIQQVVESIIDKCFAEDQLNECELTLKDLNEIAKAFTRILSSIYHQRVEYPKETLDSDTTEMSVFEESDESRNNKPSQK